jgi:hypothetical protein
MKSIANQYRDLKEGRMSQFNFMRNLRMSMSQVTNTTSFGDAVKILKNKGIITEALTDEEEVFSQGAQDENYDYNRVGTGGYDNVSEENEKPEGEETNDSDAEFDAILKQLEDEMAGEEAVKAQYDETLNENKEIKAVDENIEEVTTGIQIEHECHPDMEYDAVEKLVKKNIKKNPNYYTNYKLTGIRDYEVQTMDSSKPEDHQMKFYTEKTAVDTARGMKKIKAPKKVEEKKKLKEELENEATMRFKDLPADSEKYKIVRDSKNYIIKATNADGVEFQKGDTAKTYDGEEIKIVKFEESQGKVKAIYNKGMFFASIDIDGLEAPKPTMRPGVDMGKSMEKLKNMVREIVKEMQSDDQEIDDMAMVMDEYFDGRDNLDAENEVN